MHPIIRQYLHTLRDGEDLGGGGGDRGDEIVVVEKDAPLTDDEKKVAEELKVKEKADADAKAAKEAKDKKEEDDDDDDDPETKDKKRDTRIPLSRHKEILEEERLRNAQLTAKLSQYEGAEDVAKTNEELTKAEERLLGLEAEHTKLIVDGKIDDANRKMTEIRKLDRDINEIRMDLKTAAAESRAYEKARYDTTVDRVQAAYPVLNDDNKEHADPEQRFNPKIVKKVLSIAHAYQLDGLTPSAALQEAVKDLLGEPKTAKQKEAVDVKPRVTEAEAAKAKREEDARLKAAEAAGKQPAGGKGVGKDSDKLGGGGSITGADVMKLSYADFSKLDEATLSRLRGDQPE